MKTGPARCVGQSLHIAKEKRRH